MAIKVNLDVLMAQKKKGLTELAKEVDITLANLSILLVMTYWNSPFLLSSIIWLNLSRLAVVVPDFARSIYSAMIS